MAWNNTCVQEMQKPWAIGSLCKTVAHTYCKVYDELRGMAHYEFEIYHKSWGFQQKWFIVEFSNLITAIPEPCWRYGYKTCYSSSLQMVQGSQDVRTVLLDMCQQKSPQGFLAPVRVIKCADCDERNMLFTKNARGSLPPYIDGLMQERRNSSALAMELRLLALSHRYIIDNSSLFFDIKIYSGFVPCICCLGR